MARGITQAQVNEAADAILGAGENPTVEKVRVELGTGSPNTITRMLEVWRGGLGERLRQLSALPEVPSSVGQAMIELWRLATEHASHMLEGRFAKERSALEAAGAQLMQEREAWEIRLLSAETQVAQAQTARELAEHDRNTLDGQLQDSYALRTDLAQQRDRLQDQSDQQSVQILALRDQLDESRAALRAERERQEAHIRVVEDRSHQEVDRARQDAKQWQQRFEAAERIHQGAIASLQEQLDALRSQLRRAENDVARHVGLIAGLEKALAKPLAVATRQSKAKTRGPKPVAGSRQRTKPRSPKTPAE